jgi:urease accessory protein
MRLTSVLFSLPFALLLAEPAAAHDASTANFSFAQGFLHPLGGIDHLLAMFAVGLLAAQLGGRALWVLPGTFVLVMVGGALFGFAAFDLPGVEHAIALSLITIALPAALAIGMPPLVAALYVGVFALFHGHAHGSELPAGGEIIFYVAGFATATALIHAAGIAFGIVSRGVPARFAAAAVGVIGLMFILT